MHYGNTPLIEKHNIYIWDACQDGTDFSTFIASTPIFVQSTIPNEVVIRAAGGLSFIHIRIRHVLVLLHKLGVRY